MPTHVIPTQRIDSVYVGTIASGLVDPQLLLVINNTPYTGGFIEYFSESSWKIYFPTYTSQTGEIRLYCHAVNYNSTVPSTTINNVEVYVAY